SAERPEDEAPEAFATEALAALFTELALLDDLDSDFLEDVFLLRVSATVMTPLAGEPEIIPEE
ncbi:MAG: hypothetical protein ACO3TC_04305, partial [Burkholderiaceae bacterium]